MKDQNDENGQTESIDKIDSDSSLNTNTDSSSLPDDPSIAQTDALSKQNEPSVSENIENTIKKESEQTGEAERSEKQSEPEDAFIASEDVALTRNTADALNDTPPAHHHTKTNATAKDTASPPPKKKSRAVYWIILLILLLIAGVAAYGIYEMYQHFNKQSAALSKQIDSLAEERSQFDQKFSNLNNENTKQNKQHDAISNQFSQMQQRIDSAEQRLASQRKRILSMSTTSREDWLLAEAEYLLKLANQRILVERNAQGARTLLIEADNILKDLDDPDLFPIRQQLAKDIANVRLIEKIDVEGLYLRMQALVNMIDVIPTNPNWEQRKKLMINDNENNLDTNTSNSHSELSIDQSAEDIGSPTTLLGRLKAGFKNFTYKMDDYIRIRKHQNHDAGILLIPTPEQSAYYKQNLQLMIERASISLLREQQVIFENSLSQAQKWLNKKFPASNKRDVFLDELETIKKTNIVQVLPDITPSLEALKEYILKLHSLEGTAAESGGK